VSERYELVTLKNDARSVRSLNAGETFHPVAGPATEAEALYVRQLRLRERLSRAREFVIWDVGLGAGGNALTAIRQLGDISGALQISSFDRTLDALRFALQHAGELQFPLGFEEPIRVALERGGVAFQHGELKVSWQICLADFPALIVSSMPQPAPQVIFFDAFSPARNPEMWTLPLFENLFRCLDSRRPCALATFSRSTAARVAMLLAGFFVGVGESIAGKEETTVAANAFDMIFNPLDRRWLERARVSKNAEPLLANVYRRAPLSPESWEKLSQHPQFQ
jgi:queuine tRNA-ribosyltransferase